MSEIRALRRIFDEAKIFAIVGLSADWYRPSYFVAKYLQEHGFRIVPVNPRYEQILGERCYPDLHAIPFAIDVVDVFRKPVECVDLAQQAVTIGARVLWLQLGVVNEEARAIAEAHRLTVVMNRCAKIEYARLFGGLNWLGVNTPGHLSAAPPLRPSLRPLPMSDRQYGFDTLCLHAGQIPDSATGARAAPVYQTTSFVFDSPEHAASLFNLQTFGNVYARISNPTVAVLEERVAALENGRAALATASGMAAQAIAILNVAEAGDEVVAARTLYGGSITQLDVTLRKLGITTHFVDADDPENFAVAIGPRTKLLYAETIGNPSLNVIDIAAIARIANQADVALFIDNTFASPYLCRPFEHGAAIVLHSATKFLGGHGTTMGGIIVESGQFPWNNGRYPSMVEPSSGYHGIRFYETFGDFSFTTKCRMEGLRTLGPALSPPERFLLLQGVETLPLRMQRHCANALAVARFLEAHSKVRWVNYPGLASSRYHALAQRYLPQGAGAVLTFGIVGGAATATRFIQSVEFLSHLANVGDAKTLVIHPASTTHRQLSEDQLSAAGITPDLIRISVGLESLDDIFWDIDQALAAATR